MGRHHLEDEAEAEEDPATPPASSGEKISGLPDADESVGRRARSAKIGSESGALAGLQKDCRHQDNAVDEQQCE
jgi:hypothetical protein